MSRPRRQPWSVSEQHMEISEDEAEAIHQFKETQPMSTMHTPGPWTVTNYGRQGTLYIQAPTRRAAVAEIAGDDVAAYADAALIATAPELLAAAREVLLNTGADQYPAPTASLDRLRTAIAHAEGRACASRNAPTVDGLVGGMG